MHPRLYRWDPLCPRQREELEDDLIAFCERELELIGDVEGLDVLYAGGSSVLWLEGLSQRIGAEGSLTALERDGERVAAARELLGEAELAAPVEVVCGSVFEPPFAPRSFDLIYSAGLWHELEVGRWGIEAALFGLAALLGPGGRLASSDFVDSVKAVQVEHEAWEARGYAAYGIGPTRRLVEAHRGVLEGVRWQEMEPFYIRHLGELVLEEEGLPPGLRQRIRREGYTRPATVYVEGYVSDLERG